jgi:hypothetical protein
MEQDHLEKTKQVMVALLRQPPKPHDQMKLGKPRNKTAKRTVRRKRKTIPLPPSPPSNEIPKLDQLRFADESAGE